MSTQNSAQWFNPASDVLEAGGNGIVPSRLSTAQRTSLVLGPNDVGRTVIDVTLGGLFVWSGAAWVSGGAVLIAAADTQVLFDDGGAIAGNAGLTFIKGTGALTASGTITGNSFSGAGTGLTGTAAALNIGGNAATATSATSATTATTATTATNLGGGLAGSLPYQTAAGATSFLAIGAANTVATSSGTAPQWSTSLNLSGSVTTPAFFGTSGSITASAPFLTGSQTWNNAAVQFTGESISITDTASASNSLVANWQVNGATVFSVTKGGIINFSGGAATTQVLFDDGGAIAGNAAFTFTKATGAVNLTGPLISTSGTLTASTPAFQVSQTWNNAGATFTGSVVNITDTASAAASSFVEYQIGGIAKYRIRKDGASLFPDGSNSNPSIASFNYPTVGFSVAGSTTWVWGNSNNDMAFNAGSGQGLFIRSDALYGWSSSTNANASPDVRLYRDAAGVVGLRNGASANGLNIYLRYTDASTYSKLQIDYGVTTATTATIQVKSAGSGQTQDNLQILSNRNLYLYSQGGFSTGIYGANIVFGDQGTSTTRWSMSNIYNWQPGADNSYDIGTTLLRPRTLYAATSLEILAGTATASVPVLNLSQTWNNAGVNFAGAVLNVTNTASNAASRLLDLQVAGVSQFKAQVNGIAYTPNGWAITNGSSATGGFYWTSSTGFYLEATGTGNQVRLENGTNPQSLWVYNTRTNDTNWERAGITWNTVANICYIGTANTGSGSARAVNFQTGSSSRWQLDTSGNFLGLGSWDLAPFASSGTNMTAGFIYIAANAGTPTGTPTARTGTVATYYDTTNNKFYVYNGAWKSVTLA